MLKAAVLAISLIWEKRFLIEYGTTLIPSYVEGAGVVLPFLKKEGTFLMPLTPCLPIFKQKISSDTSCGMFQPFDSKAKLKTLGNSNVSYNDDRPLTLTIGWSN